MACVQGEARALGAAVAALGLSNKAIYADAEPQSQVDNRSTAGPGGYTEGPDLAPSAAPSAVAGSSQLTALMTNLFS